MNDYQPGIAADRGQSYASLEKIALKVRSGLVPGLGIGDALPGVALFESLSRFTVDVNGKNVALDFAVHDPIPGIEAMTLYQVGRETIVVTLSEETYSHLENENPRARLTLGHEIGHAVMHSAEIMRLSHMPHGQAALYRGSPKSHQKYMDTEWQATAFAASLLVPAAGLHLIERAGEGLSAELIRDRFAISNQAAEIRLSVYRNRKREILK